MYRVIIVDDEQLMREAMRIMISAVDGFEVAHTIGTAEEAIEICKTEKVDIVFMDIMMPGMSGIDASKIISKINKNLTTYIVSAYKSFECARGALKAGAKEYFTKPLSFSMVKTVLKEYLENHKKYDAQIEFLFSIIKEKDFRKMYYCIPQIVDEIYLYAGDNAEQVKNDFLKVGQSLILSLGWEEEGYKSCEDLFPLSDVYSLERKGYEFWLFNVMNYVFQQSGARRYKVLETVFKYIDKNITKGFGLNEIVESCNISQGYLSRLFMQQMNVSVVEYIHMRKLALAKAYFLFKDLSITDVAFRLGYNESSYFCKVFKKYEHITVFQYKKTLGLQQKLMKTKVGDHIV